MIETGKVIIRFVKTIDTFKKLNYENILEEDLQNNLDEIPIDYFMSDCEEGSSDDDYEESENENENEILFKFFFFSLSFSLSGSSELSSSQSLIK